MALAGELAKYIGGELVKNTGKELATNATTSALSNLAPKIATKVGASMANKIGNEMIAGSVLDKLVPKTRMLDKAGKPVTLYHSTPNTFDKFDDAMLGSNTGYDNTALGHFVTPDKDFSKRFIDIDNVGKTGKTMELQANVKNPITHPYMAGQKYNGKELDKKVEDYFIATNNQDGLASLRKLAEEDGTSLYDAYMDLTFGGDSPFEYSADDRKALLDNGYDAVEVVEGPKSGLVEGSKDNTPVSSYAVFNGENLRPVRHIPINQISNTEEVPVSTLRKLFRGQKKGSDDLYYNKGDGTTGSATVGNGYYMTPNADKAGVWAGEGINPISIEANTKDILTKNELVEKTKWANELINDEAYMADLWDKDPDMADFIENLSMGRLPEVSKYLDKPFIQPDSGQGEELAETIFFPDTRPELTQSIRNSLKEKSSKAGQSGIGLSPQQQEFFKDSVVRDKPQGLPADFNVEPLEYGQWGMTDKTYDYLVKARQLRDKLYKEAGANQVDADKMLANWQNWNSGGRNKEFSDLDKQISKEIMKRRGETPVYRVETSKEFSKDVPSKSGRLSFTSDIRTLREYLKSFRGKDNTVNLYRTTATPENTVVTPEVFGTGNSQLEYVLDVGDNLQPIATRFTNMEGNFDEALSALEKDMLNDMKKIGAEKYLNNPAKTSKL